MIITKEEYLDVIAEKIMALKVAVATNGKRGRFNIHKAAEGFIMPLLEHTYGRKLKNLNDRRNPNYPAIDLGALDKSVAYQVTSQNEREKIIETLETAKKHNIFLKYDKVVVLMIKDKKEYYNFKGVDLEGINFNPDTDVMDLDDLLKDMENLTLDDTEAIHDFVKKGLKDINSDSFLDLKNEGLIDVENDQKEFGLAKHEYFKALITLQNVDFSFQKLQRGFAEILDDASDTYLKRKGYLRMFWNKFIVSSNDSILYDMKEGENYHKRHYILRFKKNEVLLEFAQYKGSGANDWLANDLSFQLYPLLAIIVIVKKIYKSKALELKIDIDTENNAEIIYQITGNIIMAVTNFASTYKLSEGKVSFSYHLDSLDNDKLIGLLEKLVENYKTSNELFQRTKNLYLFLDEAEQAKKLDSFKKVFD